MPTAFASARDAAPHRIAWRFSEFADPRPIPKAPKAQCASLGCDLIQCSARRYALFALVGALEDAEDYHAFEMAVAADYGAQSAAERELVLRLASVLWRLRRATAMETGLFEIQARQLLQFRRSRHAQQAPLIVNEWPGSPETFNSSIDSELDSDRDGVADGLTQIYLRLCNLQSFPLDRLSRYEASLWRQACQIIFILQSCGRRKRWNDLR